MKRLKFSEKFLYIPVVLLAINLIFRLIDQSKIIYTFPLDLVNDGSSYMALLYFLDNCGFHNLCPYWYNGFISFQLTPPGWYFFVYPLFLVFKNYQVAYFSSILLIFILAFYAVYKFGKIHKINLSRRLLFFFLLFANAASIGNYIRLGRIPEFLSFLLFIIIAFVILYYKDKKLDWKIILLIPIYSLILITHQAFAILASFLWISLFLVKNKREKGYIIALVLSSILIILFWLIPYLQNFFISAGVEEPIGKNILTFTP